VATAWNALRQQICDDAVKKFLVPHSVKWLKEHLKRQAEEFVAERCRMELEYVSLLHTTKHDAGLIDSA
jgi:transcription elongation factor SPT6